MFQVGLLMGISWICGLIASSADITLFWWLFVIITSLQGPLLLVSTLCSTQFRYILGKQKRSAKVANQQKHSGDPRSLNCPGRPGCSTSPDSEDETRIRRRSMLLKRYDSQTIDNVNEKDKQISDVHFGGKPKNYGEPDTGKENEQIDDLQQTCSSTNISVEVGEENEQIDDLQQTCSSTNISFEVAEENEQIDDLQQTCSSTNISFEVAEENEQIDDLQQTCSSTNISVEEGEENEQIDDLQQTCSSTNISVEVGEETYDTGSRDEIHLSDMGSGREQTV